MHSATSPFSPSSTGQHSLLAPGMLAALLPAAPLPRASDTSASALGSLQKGTGFLQRSTQSSFHCTVLLRDVFSKVHVAVLKRLHCYYYSNRVGGHLSLLLLVLGRMQRVALCANKLPSVCALKSLGSQPANCWGPPKDDSDPCWKCSDQPSSKQFRNKTDPNKTV